MVNYLLFFGLFIVCGAGSLLFHEVGHVLIAIANNVPLSEIQFGWYNIGLSVTVPSYFPRQSLSLYHYAGGLISGSILVLLFLARNIKPFRSNMTQEWSAYPAWWINELILFWAVFQYFNGYLEGARFIDYASDARIMNLAVIFSFPVSFIANACVTLIRNRISHPRSRPMHA